MPSSADADGTGLPCPSSTAIGPDNINARSVAFWISAAKVTAARPWQEQTGFRPRYPWTTVEVTRDAARGADG